MTFGRNFFLMFCFIFYGCAILLFTEAAIKVVPVSYYYYYNGQHPQQQFVQYANQQQKISNNRIQNSRVMNANPKTDQWNTNPSPKDKDDAWDIKENQQKMKQPKHQTEPISQNSIQKQQMQTDNYEPISSNQIQPNQRTDQYQPVFSNQFQQKQQHTDQNKPASTNQIQPDDRSDSSQPISQQNMIGNNNNINNNKYTPWNVHNNYYTSYDDCDPWCRAHCATKRTPEFCFRTGPCMHNCYRIVTNFLRARRM